MSKLVRIVRRYVRSGRRLLRMHRTIRFQFCAVPALFIVVVLVLIVNRVTLWVLSFESVVKSMPPAVLLWVFATPMVGAFLGGVVVAVLHVRLASRSMKLLVQHQGCVCPRCLHDLRAMPGSSRCPECGTRYRRRWLRKLWSQAMFFAGGKRAASRIAALFEPTHAPESNRD
jgi:hypothetical protein